MEIATVQITANQLATLEAQLRSFSGPAISLNKLASKVIYEFFELTFVVAKNFGAEIRPQEFSYQNPYLGNLQVVKLRANQLAMLGAQTRKIAFG